MAMRGGITSILLHRVLPALGTWGSSFLCAFVLLDSAIPGGSQRAGEDVLVGCSQTNVSCSHSPPSARYREEDFRQFTYEIGLLLGCKQQVSVALLLSSVGSENS